MAKKKSTKTTKTIPAAKPVESLAYGLLALAMVYGFASWAIDSGSLWLYFFSFVSVYFAVVYIKKFVILQFTNHDNTKKSRRA